MNISSRSLGFFFAWKGNHEMSHTLKPCHCPFKECCYKSHLICTKKKKRKERLGPSSYPSHHIPILLFHIVSFGRLYYCEPGIIKNKNKQWPWPCLGVSMETRPHYKALPTVCDWQTRPAKDVPNKFEGTVETYPAGCKLPLLLLISTWLHLDLLHVFWPLTRPKKKKNK